MAVATFKELAGPDTTATKSKVPSFEDLAGPEPSMSAEAAAVAMEGMQDQKTEKGRISAPLINPYAVGGMGGFSPGITRETAPEIEKANRSRFRDAVDRAASGLAMVGSGLTTGAAGLMDISAQIPSPYMRPKGEVDKDIKKLSESADFLWEVSKDPELAAQNTDLLSKGLNLAAETVPYITATSIGVITAGPLGGFAIGGMVEGNSSYRTALDYGVPEEKAKQIGAMVGVAAGAIEAFGGRYAEQLFEKVARKIANKGVRTGAVFGIGTVVEALEEGSQEIAHITGEETYRDVDWKEATKRTLGSMAAGGFLGGTMKVGTTAVRGLPSAIEPTIPTEPSLPTEKPPHVPTEPLVTPEKPEVEVAVEPRKPPVREPEVAEEPVVKPAEAEPEAIEPEQALVIYKKNMPNATEKEIVQALLDDDLPLTDKMLEKYKELPAAQEQIEQKRIDRIIKERAAKAPEAKPEAKQPWEMTEEELAKHEMWEIPEGQIYQQVTIGQKIGKYEMFVTAPRGEKQMVEEVPKPKNVEIAKKKGIFKEQYGEKWYKPAPSHISLVKQALEQNKPVPREVLEEYKSEKWAAEALEKPAIEKRKPEIPKKPWEKVKTQLVKEIPLGVYDEGVLIEPIEKEPIIEDVRKNEGEEAAVIVKDLLDKEINTIDTHVKEDEIIIQIESSRNVPESAQNLKILSDAGLLWEPQKGMTYIRIPKKQPTAKPAKPEAKPVEAPISPEERGITAEIAEPAEEKPAIEKRKPEIIEGPITKAEKNALREKGYKVSQILKMSPERARELLLEVPAEEGMLEKPAEKVEEKRLDQIEKKVPELKVDKKPGPAKTLDSIREEGKQPADLTIIKPTEKQARKITPATGKKKTYQSLTEKGKLSSLTDLGNGIGVKGKSLYHIATQKEIGTFASSTAARKAATVMTEETEINWKDKDFDNITKQWLEWLQSKGLIKDSKGFQRGETENVKQYMTGKGKELEPEDYASVFHLPALKSKYGYDLEKATKYIGNRLYNFAREVPEFTLNPTFTFEKESGQLVFRNRYRFAFYPEVFGLNSEDLKEGQTIRFDLESFGIKPASAKALKKAEAFLGEPKIVKATKKKIPIEKMGEVKKPKKPTKEYAAYRHSLTDIETGKEFFPEEGDPYNAVSPELIKTTAELGKKAGLQGWTVERDILLKQESGEGFAKARTPIPETIKIVRGVFKEKPKPKAGRAIGDVGAGVGRIQVSMEPGGKVQTAAEIIKYIETAFNIPMRGVATHRKKYPAWFDPKAVGIRMKDVRALTNAMHEIGHHIDWTLNNRLSKNPPNSDMRKELLSLGKALYGTTKPPGGYKSEGFAEFIREYLTGDEAETKAPAVFKWFKEDYLPKNSDIDKKLDITKGMITKWRAQGAEARIESQISKKRTKGTMFERMKRASLWVERAFRSELEPIRRAMKRVGIKESEILPGDNPYQIAVARADKSGAIARFFVEENTTDLSGNVTGKGLREIIKPVTKDIKTFTQWIVAARARLLHKKGINPGISSGDANYAYEKYDNPQWQETLKEITEWNHRVLDYLVEAGGLEKKARDTIIAANPIYIPFMREFLEGEISFVPGIGKGVAKTKKAVKKIKGSGRAIIDPFESMIQQAAKIIGVAHKTEVALALAKFAKEKGTAGMIWKVPAPTQATQFQAEQLKKDIARIAYQRMGLDPDEVSAAMLEQWDEVLTVYSNASHYYGKDNIVSFSIDGKRQFYEVEPNLYRAIEGLDRYTMQRAWDFIFGKPARAVRLGATGLNASFGLIRNFLRDALTFTVLAKHAKAGPLSAVRGIAEDIARTTGAQKFKSLGGKMSAQILADRRALQHLKKEILVSTVPGKVVYTVAHPVDALRELFGVSEAGTRIGEFIPALKAAEKKYGKGSRSAAIEALNAAQDVTTNFSRHGQIGKVLNQVIPFFNAAIQGPDKILRTFAERPATTTLKAIFALTLPALWLWWRHKDDEWYKNMPDYERISYMHFKIPGKDTIIRIPVPFELGHIFQSAPVAALDARYRKDPKLVTEMFSEVLEQANPVDWPALIGPYLDVRANRDFAGRPIVPRGVEHKMPQDQYKRYTTALMKKIGKTINYSPAKLEHMVNNYSGGLFLRVSRTIDLKNKKDITESDMPVIGTLFLRESYAPRAQLERFYTKRDELNRKYSSKRITAQEKRKRKRYNSSAEIISGQLKKLTDAKTQGAKVRIYSVIKRQLRKFEGAK